MKKIYSSIIKKTAAFSLAAILAVSGGVLPEGEPSEGSRGSIFSANVSAASVRKCYTILDENTPVFSDTALTPRNRIGCIYGSDEVTVNNVTSRYVDVSYPTDSGRVKRGFIAPSAVLLNVNGIASCKAKCRITTYKRTDTSDEYGYVDAGDSVMILGELDGMVQIKYPVSAGYKYAFVTASDARRSLGYFGPSSADCSEETYYVTTSAGLNLRSSPSVNSAVLAVMRCGEEIKVSSVSGGWARVVSYNGRSGYCSADYISKTKPAAAPSYSDDIISYSQTDSRWSGCSYGYSDTEGTQSTTVGRAGCGVLSLTNAAANIAGTFIDPAVIASYSVKYGYRVNGVGTDHGLYESFCNNRGSRYGIKYVCYTDSWSEMREYLESGNAAIVCVPNHIMTLVGYDSSAQEFLLIDSAPNSRRGTSKGYAWKTESELKDIGMYSDFYIIGKA